MYLFKLNTIYYSILNTENLRQESKRMCKVHLSAGLITISLLEANFLIAAYCSLLTFFVGRKPFGYVNLPH